jgi:hypothetical protein
MKETGTQRGSLCVPIGHGTFLFAGRQMGEAAPTGNATQVRLSWLEKPFLEG